MVDSNDTHGADLLLRVGHSSGKVLTQQCKQCAGANNLQRMSWGRRHLLPAIGSYYLAATKWLLVAYLSRKRESFFVGYHKLVVSSL